MTKRLIVALATLAVSAFAGAAEISWTARELTGKTSDIVTEGETVLAFAPVAFSIDGVNFVNHSSDDNFKFSSQNNCVLNIRKPNTQASSIAQTAAVFNQNGPTVTGGYQTMLENGYYNNDSGSNQKHLIQLRNLTIGDKYIVQLIVHDSRNATMSARTAWIADDNDTKLAEVRYGDTGDGNWKYGGALVGEFTADAMSESFYVDFPAGAGQINAFQIRRVGSAFAVPKLADGWYARPTLGLGKDVIIDGRSVFAYTSGSAVEAAPMVNNVAFTVGMTTGTSWGDGAVTLSPNFKGAYNSFGSYGSGTHGSTYAANVHMGNNALGSLLNTGLYNDASAVTKVTFTLNNLIAGKHYAVQLFFMAMNGSGSTSRTASVNGNTVRYGDNTDGNWTQGGYLLGIFTPDSTTYSFDVDYSTSAAQLNAIQLREFDREWTYDATARTLSFNGNVVSNVTASAKNLTLGSNAANPLAVDLDFSYPIADGYSVVTIAGIAFSGNTALRRFVAPSSLRTINWEGFSSSGLEYVELNEGLATMGQLCFSKCTSLTKVVNPIPSTVTTQSYSQYMNCSSLPGDFTIAATGTYASHFRSTAVSSLNIVNATALDGYAGFTGMPNLHTVYLSTNLTTIGSAARVFGDCGTMKFNLYWRSCPTSITTDLFAGDNSNCVTNYLPWHLRKQWIAFMKSASNHYFWMDGVRVDENYTGVVTSDSVGQWGFGTEDWKARQVIRFWNDPLAPTGLVILYR